MQKIVIGYNPAANMLPMFYFLDRSNPKLEFVNGVPAAHNRLMAEGKLDMAPISAFSFGQHWGKYSLLADLSVSAKGPFGSLLLFSKFELPELDGRSVALTNTSASTVNMLKIILDCFYHIKPVFKTMPPKLDAMLAEADAALLIADEALAGLARNNNELLVYDVSQEWEKHTGLSMTFAVWTVSNSALEKFPAGVDYVHKLLLESKQKGLANVDKIIDYCITNLGHDPKFWSVYFSQLRYGLEPELLQGLNTYFRYCVDLGLLPSQPQINIWP